MYIQKAGFAVTEREIPWMILDLDRCYYIMSAVKFIYSAACGLQVP